MPYSDGSTEAEAFNKINNLHGDVIVIPPDAELVTNACVYAAAKKYDECVDKEDSYSKTYWFLYDAFGDFLFKCIKEGIISKDVNIEMVRENAKGEIEETARFL